MKADRLLAERLQSRDREELTDEEKAKLFMELIEKRRQHFAALRAQEKRNRPPTKAQKRTQMSTYLKHMEGSEETTKGSRKKMLGRKRAGKEQQQQSLKKQKVEKEKESEEVEEVDEIDEAELKKLLVIKNDKDITIDAILLAIKLPVITDYKLLKKGMMIHYQLIRADGSSKRYSSMIRMLQGIDREDLEALWRIVKAKYGDKRPENEFERVLWGDLKVIFKPDKRSDVWRILQGYRVTIWKLIDSSGVHFTNIHADNGSAICVVKNLVYHSKTKHIEILHHFIRDSYQKRLIEMVKIHTDNNVADLLTKAFDAPRHHGGAPAQTKSERVLEKSNEPPLLEGHTSESGKGRMEHQFELMANVPLTPHDSPLPGGYTPGSDEVKILERQRKSSNSQLRRRKYRQFESLDDDLDKEDASKQGKGSDKIKPILCNFTLCLWMLEAEEESTMAFELIKFIKSMLEE
ncbi:hypothetical protein Tco_1368776 [Tanacetum coccineum]